jgi:hypothetical protein
VTGFLRTITALTLWRVGNYRRKTVPFQSRSHSSDFFEFNRFKPCTTLGTIGLVAGKPPRRLHFFGHRAKLIEVLTRKTQQHRDLFGFACSWVFRKQVVKLTGLCDYAATCSLLSTSKLLANVIWKEKGFTLLQSSPVKDRTRQGYSTTSVA